MEGSLRVLRVIFIHVSIAGEEDVNILFVYKKDIAGNSTLNNSRIKLAFQIVT